MNSFKFPDKYVYEGTNAEGLKVRVMVGSHVEATKLITNGYEIQLVDTCVGMKITCE